MKRWIVLLAVLSTLFAALGLTMAAPVAGSPDSAHVYHETFDTTTHMDAAHTSAVWDTTGGQLRLDAPLPLSEGVAQRLYHPSAWSAAVHVPSTGRVYLFGGTGDAYGIQEYDPATKTCVKSGAGLPYALYGAAAIYVESRDAVYLLGGASQTDVVVFDVERAATVVLTDVLPAPLSYASAVYVPDSDKAYIFGGMAVDGTELQSILEYDLSVGTVVTLSASLPVSVARSSAIYDSVTGSAYVFGGQYQGISQEAILRFDVGSQSVTQVGRLPFPCSDTCAVLVPEQHRAYIFGGLGFMAWPPLDQIVAFDIGSTSAVELTATLPSQRNGVAAAYVPSDGIVYVLGGHQVWFSYDDILALDIGTQTLEDRSVHIDGRAGASAVYVPETSKAYLFGGQSGEEAASQTILVYDVDQAVTDMLEATLPISRTDTAAAYDPVTNRAYVFGGWWPDDGSQYFCDILHFDAVAETLVASGAVLPVGRAGMAAAAVPSTGEVYLFGGHGDSGCSNEILVYDLEHDTLMTLPATLPTPAAYAAAVYDAILGKVYLFGGWNPDILYNYLDQIVVFDVQTQAATLLPDTLPLLRGKAAAIAIPGESMAYVIGGTYGSARCLQDVLSFDMATGVVTSVQDMRLDVSRSAAGAIYVRDEATAFFFGGTGTRADIALDDIVALQFVYPLSGSAQSSMVNAAGQKIFRALLTAEQAPQGGAVAYSLSNDGGGTWADVQLGREHNFAVLGSDLRWRVVLSGGGRTTPIVSSMTITYADTLAPVYRVSLPVVLKAPG